MALQSDGAGRSTLAFRLPRTTDLVIRVDVAGAPLFQLLLMVAAP